MTGRFLINLMLSFILLGALCAGGTVLAEGDPAFTYEINADGTTATITAVTGDTSGTVSIPETLDGYSVTETDTLFFVRYSLTTATLITPSRRFSKTR